MEFAPRPSSKSSLHDVAAARGDLGKVLVVSRERLWAVALGRLLEEESELVVGTLSPDSSSDLARKIAMIEPTLVILDCRQGGSGARASDAGVSVGLVVRSQPEAAVIVVVGSDALESSVASLKSGAVGVLGSDASHDDLHAAVEAVRAGELFLSQAILREFVAVVADAVRRERRTSDGLLDTLSQRESDVLDCLTQGMSNAEIAGSLRISQATVKLHLAKIMTKWGVRDRVQVVIKAFGH